MKRFIVTTALTILTAITLSHGTIDADIPPLPKVLTPQETIVKYAQVFASPVEQIQSIARCESGYKQNVIGGEGEIGMMQFKKATFESMAKAMGETLDIHSYSDQIKLVSWVSVHKPEWMRQWTTWRAIQNGGTYTFTSKKTGITHTVNCK